jgi:hypothetical protein
MVAGNIEAFCDGMVIKTYQPGSSLFKKLMLKLRTNVQQHNFYLNWS